MHRFWSTLLVAVCASAPLQVHAQTAEDTIAFMLYGVEDGAQQFETSVVFDRGGLSLQTRKSAPSIWQRGDNGLYSTHISRGDHSNTLQIVIRRLSSCEYSLVVSSIYDSGDRDLDDETQITVDFSKLSSIVYRGQHKETGLREFPGALRITTAAPNAICYEFRYDLSLPRPRTETKCLAEGQHLFPTALPFSGLSRPPELQEVAVARFKQKFCPMRAPS